MPSLADLFPEFPLCQACEALFTAPRLADGELSIPEQIFQKYNRHKHKTDPEYHYQRSRGKLEKSVMLGCELYKRVAKGDLNYSHWKHKEQVHCEYEDSDEAAEDDLASHLICSVKPWESFVLLTSFETAKKWFIQYFTKRKNCQNLATDEIPTGLVELSPLEHQRVLVYGPQREKWLAMRLLAIAGVARNLS
ncbi:hypothetical protein V8E51_013652 [Hyaloscypha variabilis]